VKVGNLALVLECVLGGLAAVIVGLYAVLSINDTNHMEFAVAAGTLLLAMATFTLVLSNQIEN